MKNVIIDISSLLQSNFVTGIQRVVLEWSKRLISNYPNNVFLLKCERGRVYISKSYPIDLFQDFYNLRNNIKYRIYNVKKNKNGKCNILLDIDSVWSYDYARAELYRELKRNGTQIFSLINDIVPIENPQFMRDFVLYPSFINYINAIMHYSDYVLFSSRSTMEKTEALFAISGFSKTCFVIPFGSDFKDMPTKSLSYREKTFLNSLHNKKYLLSVGTIEPRKNYDYLLDSFPLINDKSLNLVIVGRIGWKCDSFIRKIKKSNMHNKRIFIINNASDILLEFLYKRCWGFVMPSFDEGFGLPLIESAKYGNLIFCSDIPVFREILKDKAIYFDNKKPKDLADKINYVCSHPKFYLSTKRNLCNLHFFSWDESFLVLNKILKIQ